MKRVLLSTVATVSAALFVATGASAAEIVECAGAGCVQTDENVLLTDATGVAVVTGETNQTGAQVLFTSDTDTLNAEASGQSTITAVDEVLNSLTFSLQGFSFQTAEFNLLNGLISPIEVSILTSSGATDTFTIDNSNGSNWFAITADAGEVLTSATFTSAGGFDSFRQLRLGGVTAAVPEPGTWAMMLLGFGAIGFSMRRRQRALLTQAA